MKTCLISIVIFFLSCIAFNSCKTAVGKGDDGNILDFTLDDFREMNLSGVERRVITDDPDLVGKAREIRIVNDSIVLIRQHSPSLVSFYYIGSGRSGTAITQGGGSLEMSMVGNMYAEDEGKLWVFGVDDMKVMKLTFIPGNEKPYDSEYVAKAPCPSLRGVALSDSLFMTLPAVADGQRLLIFDRDRNPVDTLGVFPEVNKNEGVVLHNLVFQSDIDYDKGNGHAVLANRSWNQIEIYDINDGEVIARRGPIEVRSEIKDDSSSGMNRMSQIPLWFIYDGICAGPSTFVVGYIGIEVKEEKDFDRHIGRLLEFDWAGNPLRSYRLPDEIMAFDIDFKNGRLYTIENCPEPSVVCYDVKQFFQK